MNLGLSGGSTDYRSLRFGARHAHDGCDARGRRRRAPVLAAGIFMKCSSSDIYHWQEMNHVA
jgi:hypothetical protein